MQALKMEAHRVAVDRQTEVQQREEKLLVEEHKILELKRQKDAAIKVAKAFVRANKQRLDNASVKGFF